MKIEKEKAIKLYPDAPQWLKYELEDEFGNEFWITKSYEKIKTLEDALIANGSTRAEFNKKVKGWPHDTMCYEARKEIAKAIKGDWETDWTDTSDRKWFPYFDLSSGCNFSGSTQYHYFSNTDVGSRFSFPTEEQSDYFGKNFTKYHEGFLTIKK